jgi:signal peptidase II
MTPAIVDQPSKPSIPISHYYLFWSIALFGMTFDLATKYSIFSWLGPQYQRGPYTIIKNVLELQTSHNTGALWGFMRGVPKSSLIFAVLSIIAALGICYWLFILGAARDRRLTIALGLIMAGALGNCYDRLVFGYVRDFVHLKIEPINFDCAIFNFADNMLVIGALLLVLHALRPDTGESAEPTTPEPAATV